MRSLGLTMNLARIYLSFFCRLTQADYTSATLPSHLFLIASPVSSSLIIHWLFAFILFFVYLAYEIISLGHYISSRETCLAMIEEPRERRRYRSTIAGGRVRAKDLGNGWRRTGHSEDNPDRVCRRQTTIRVSARPFNRTGSFSSPEFI